MSCDEVTIYYAGLMFFLSTKDWPKRYACTYEVSNYTSSVLSKVHHQDYEELFWVESGRGCHLLNGERRYVTEGYFALIRADDAHGYSAWEPGDHLRLINFAFRPGLWESLREQYFGGKSLFFDKLAIEEREYHLDANERERLRQMGLDLASGRWDKLSSTAFLLGTLTLLTNRRSRHQQPAQTPEWLMRASRSIETWPHFVGGVQEFVRLAGRSHEHVTRDCRRYLNTTPRELVNQARLRWASMQLETTQQEIIHIAEECGFGNLGHFYKLFRQHYHMTPKHYREKHGIPLS